MPFLLYFFIFILGAIVGSFLNVLILRYNTGRSLGGRSACMHCGHKLLWSNLVPILSFFLCHGRCRYCRAKISWQYPAVEALTGLVFLAVIYREFIALSSSLAPNFQLSIFTPHLLFVICYLLFVYSLLIAITVYDLRHKIIPNGFVWAFVLISFVKLFVGTAPAPIYDFAAGPILALPFVLIWFFSRGRAMGLGDAKIGLGLGWMLGLAEGVSAVLLSFWVGGLVGLFLLLNKKGRFTMKSEIPFAPFLVIGIFLAYFFQFDFLGISSIIW